MLHTLVPIQNCEYAGAKVPASIQKLLERFIRDGVRETRNQILAAAKSIPAEYKTIRQPIYRGCALLEGSVVDLLTKKVVVKDHALTSWSYDAKEALNFCIGSATRIGARRPGLLLVRRTSDKVVINFPDNVAKFGSSLRKAIEDYDQQEILVATNNERYGKKDLAAICLDKGRFEYAAQELGWKLKTSFGSKKFVIVVNPGTNPVVYGYR